MIHMVRSATYGRRKESDMSIIDHFTDRDILNLRSIIRRRGPGMERRPPSLDETRTLAKLEMLMEGRNIDNTKEGRPKSGAEG